MIVDPIRPSLVPAPVFAARPADAPVRDTFSAGPRADDDLIKRGPVLNGAEPLDARVLEGLVQPVALPEAGTYQYSSEALTMGDNGSLAAIRSRGLADMSPRTIAFFAPDGRKLHEEPTQAACLERGPDGTVFAYGSYWNNHDRKVSAYAPDGTRKWEQGVPHRASSIHPGPQGVIFRYGVGEALSVRPDGVTELPGCPSALHRVVNGDGTVCDLDLYSQTPSVQRGSVSTPLPPIPGITRDDYSGKGASPQRLDDPILLSTGAVAVTTTPLKGGSPGAWLLVPGRTEAVNLSFDPISAWSGFAEASDGTIHGVYQTPGPKDTIQRELIALSPDGTVRSRTPLPPCNDAGRQRVFLDVHDHVLVYTNFLAEGPPAMLQAFDADGTQLWQKPFDEHSDLERVESLPSGAVNLYFQGRPPFVRVHPFDVKSLERRREGALRDIGHRSEKDAPTVTVGDDFVNVGGVKVPRRRTYDWRTPAG